MMMTDNSNTSALYLYSLSDVTDRQVYDRCIITLSECCRVYHLTPYIMPRMLASTY